MYCNFTNYGSALQTYALQRVINHLNPETTQTIVLDYCPDVLLDLDVLHPEKHMWDQDKETLNNLREIYPSLVENNEKFNDFYKKNYPLSKKKYTSKNFTDSIYDENLEGYVCGSDTIWCIREFHGFDDGYYGNYPVMKKSRTISYAASFGDVNFTDNELKILKEKMQNYKSISVRENTYIDFIKKNVKVPVCRVLDPTLLLRGSDYDCITAGRQYTEPYILLYSRRYNADMESYAEWLSSELKCKIVDISIRASNRDKGHIMRYDAGVQEFLSLIKHAQFVVTNSYHGLIFSTQLHTPFVVFSREQADTKIDELLELLQLRDTKKTLNDRSFCNQIDFNKVETILESYREVSLNYLRDSLQVNKVYE